VIISISPEAEHELVDGALFYAEQADPELGLAFIAEFERVLEILRDQPNLAAPWSAMTRRFPLRRFPYFVLCVVDETELRIIALVHQRGRLGRK
jgi:plasmid stabilization system protein ParE